MPKISDIEETPNPNAVKFILREPVSNGVAKQYGAVDQAENDPLAKSLFVRRAIARSEKSPSCPNGTSLSRK